MAEKKSRWEKEAEDLLDALGGPKVNPLQRKKSTSEREKERRLAYLQKTSGGRPRKGESPDDAMVTYNFRIRQSELNELKQVAVNTTKTIRELMSEAVSYIVKKYSKD